MRNQWQDKKVIILGAARQGLALARFLSQKGAQVVLNDNRSAEQLKTAVDNMRDYPVQWVLGEHPFSLLDNTDLICVSGGVPLTIPLIKEAVKQGIRLSNDSQIFMEQVPCKVIGITGSAGKTTTTTLVGRIAKAALEPAHKVWVGGNIGLPLIDHVDEMQPDDLVVLELSSFQLELMESMPEISAILNITPNHLDRHGTFGAYVDAKKRMMVFQKQNDTLILGRDDEVTSRFISEANQKVFSFGMGKDSQRPGTYLDENQLVLMENREETVILNKEEIKLRGAHNILNALAACAISAAAGFPIEAMREGIAGFQGVPYRLEFVRELNGAAWYDDSIATAPERTLAAINAFSEPLVLLLGGRDKNLPWETLANRIHERVDHVILFGEAAGKIEAAIGDLVPEQRPFSLSRCEGLEQAVKAAASVSEAGDVVLLSPGGTSFDEFVDFSERGDWFKKWVQLLQ
jgi:UDP-N-acetylmuramoylalanine--D-glutamate ligase